MSNIAIYGASGFIGSNFADMYFDNSLCIRKDSNFSPCDQVLYLISTNNNYNIFEDPHLDIETNLNKLVEVLEEHRKNSFIGVFNFISSWFVYGPQESMPVRECAACNPNGFYSITKYAAEMMLRSYCETFGIKYRIMRLCNIIGNDTKVSPKKNALQYMFNLVKEGKDVKLYDEGLPLRDVMHVQDACRAINICMQKGNLKETYNISNSEPKTLKEFMLFAKEITGSSSKIDYMPTPSFHKTVQARDMWLDNSKLKSLGYSPSIGIWDACRKVILEN